MLSESMILDEEIDENFDPTEEEIMDYARFLGFDLPEDEDLLYIAAEAIKAPLPEEWKPCITQDGELYYFNFNTGESIWDHPCDVIYKEKFAKAKYEKMVKNKTPLSIANAVYKAKQELELSQLTEKSEEGVSMTN